MRDINYNYPLQLEELFKLHRESKSGDVTVNEDGDLVEGKTIEFDEYKRMTYILWEDIDTICGYPYEDNWKHQGEKFFIESRGKQMLILGSLEEILLNWAAFRGRYGPHQHFPGEPIIIEYKLKQHNDNQNTGDNGLVKD